MIKILIEIWPALIPSVIYGVWYYRNIASKEDAKLYDFVLERKKRYAFYALITSALIVIFMLVYFALSEPASTHIEIKNDQVNVR